MLDLPDRVRALVVPATSPPRALSPSVYRGPERRAAASTGAAGAPWLALMLDEIDYGMLLLGEEAQVLHANHAARAELDDGHPLLLCGGELRARRPQDAPALLDALQAARRGLRRLLTLGAARRRRRRPWPWCRWSRASAPCPRRPCCCWARSASASACRCSAARAAMP
jgi:hypothetical protein